MKKVFTCISTFCISIFALINFVACGDDENKSNSGDNTVYTVTAESSDFYSVNGKTNRSTAGLEAYVTIEPKFEAVVIDKVLFNGNECAKSTTEENKYTFTMPAENVAISVEYSFVDNNSDNFLTWDSENQTTFNMTTDSEEEWYNPQYDTENKLIATVSKNPSGTSINFFTEHEETVFSLNQNVIPNEALSVTDLTSLSGSGGTNGARAFEISIDRSLISEGTVQIVLLVENNHKFGDASLLVLTLNIAPAE